MSGWLRRAWGWLLSLPPATDERAGRALMAWRTADQYARFYGHLPEAQQNIAVYWGYANELRDAALGLPALPVINVRRQPEGGVEQLFGTSEREAIAPHPAPGISSFELIMPFDVPPDSTPPT